MKICTRPTCSHNGIAQPLESFPIDNKRTGARNSWCRTCYADRSRGYYAANKETIAPKSAARYAANPEPVKQRAKQWHDQNTERYNELARLRYAKDPVAGQAYYYANRESINEQRRNKAALLKQSDPAEHQRRLQRLAAWNETHPEQKVIRETRRRARKEGLPDTWNEAQRNFMHTYWGFACAVCGNQEGFQWTIANDHWIPLASKACPGTVAENMIPLCHGEGGCNNNKHSKHPERWLKSYLGPKQAAKTLKAISTYFALVHSLRDNPASPFYQPLFLKEESLSVPRVPSTLTQLSLL